MGAVQPQVLLDCSERGSVVPKKQVHGVNCVPLWQEIDMMKYVSRDANVVQFFGACIQDDSIMLITEYMPVCAPGMCPQRIACVS